MKARITQDLRNKPNGFFLPLDEGDIVEVLEWSLPTKKEPNGGMAVVVLPQGKWDTLFSREFELVDENHEIFKRRLKEIQRGFRYSWRILKQQTLAIIRPINQTNKEK